MPLGSYDDHQREAVLVQCAKCRTRYYMTIPKPLCSGCQWPDMTRQWPASDRLVRDTAGGVYERVDN